MSEIKIRTAVLDDVELLLEFEQGVIAAERPYDVTLRQGSINYYNIPEMILSPDVELAVAEYGGELVGSGYARIEKAKHFVVFDHHAYLGFMFVKEEHRGKQINKKIMEYLTQWALSKNLQELRLDVYSSNTTAINAYEKAGFSPLLVQMRLGIHK